MGSGEMRMDGVLACEVEADGTVAVQIEIEIPGVRRWLALVCRLVSVSVMIEQFEGDVPSRSF